MEFLARHYEDILLDYRFIRAIGVQSNRKLESNNDLYSKNIQFRLNQIQGVHLKFIGTLSIKFN